MSEGLNQVSILGRLGATPELRVTQGGAAVLNMRIAVNESYIDKDKVRRERTEWVTAVVWNKRAEALAKILDKGSSVFVQGSLRTTSYDDRDGKKCYRTEVVCDKVILTGGRDRDSNSDGDAPAARPAPARGGGGPAARPAPADARGHSNDDYGGGEMDDVPFATSQPGRLGL